MELNYKGLANIGATCYMNSLLQTLFMTPEFRQAIYKWKYNDKIHPKPSDSIIYQLQRLFGKLNKSFPGEVNTRDLVKSFQWEDQQAQMQQDIQEFNRVLFQALEKSLLGRKKQGSEERSHFMRDLYEGEMVAYTKCNECLYQSQREEVFQDLILNVKNVFEKIYNGSVELAIQRYMKPQYLDENNLYECSGCGNKVKAERGVRFLKMPKLLNIILRRFDFDYFTFQKIKVNDRVDFPFVLNFNNYMQGYHHITNKLDEDSSAYFLNENLLPKKPTKGNTTQMKKVVPKKNVPVAGKKTTKPSNNTKSFLEEMRRKKMMSQTGDQDLIYTSGTTQPKYVQNAFQPIKEEPTKEAQKNQPKPEEIKTPQLKMKNKQTKQSDGATEKKDQKIVQNPTENKLVPPPPPPPPPPPLTISEPFMKTQSQKNLQEQLLEKWKEKQKIDKQMQEKWKQNQIQVKQLIQKYREDGPLVYELYAVLVHSGTANAGHYYSYIKSFEDERWYCFNDERVSEISIVEIEKSFGGVGHANAYALYYRLAQKQNQERSMLEAPQYINRLIQEEIINMKQRQVQRLSDLQNILTLKIHYQLYVKQLEIHKNSSLELCLEKAREMFDLTEQTVKKHNSRLRMFNAVTQTKLETFTDREKENLMDLKIPNFKSLLLETKKEQQTFEEFVVGLMNIRIVLWEECEKQIKSLDQNYLKVHTVAIPYNGTMKQIEKRIKNKRAQVLEKKGQEDICVVKRHQNDQYSYHQIINVADYQEKNVEEIMIMENQILFIEPDSNELMWPQQFENQLYRITIKYNNPNNGEVKDFMTDSRKTLLDLKTALCSKLEMDADDLIMKRGTRSGLQLKNLALTMKESRFITGTTIYFEKGIPAKTGEVRVQLFLAFDAPNQMFNRLHEFQFIGDVPVNGLHRASEVKELFKKVVKKYRDLDLETDKFRIREKVNDKIGKIYRERPMKEQQLIEKRQIAIEMKEDNLDIKDYSIYVRSWNPSSWTLSDKMEIVVTKTTSMKDLASLIYVQNDSIPMDKMEVCRILSIHKFNILDLCDMEFYQMTQASVITEPLFVNADGLLYIVKDTQVQPRQLTKEEETKFGGTIKQLSRLRPRPNAPSYKKQKGVKIKVVEKEEEQVKENEKVQEKPKVEEEVKPSQGDQKAD